MSERKKNVFPSSKTLCDRVVEGILEKKGLDIVILDLREVGHAVTDFFVIGTGGSDVQIKVIAESVVEHVGKTIGLKPWGKEGMGELEWVLLDYVDVVVHIFNLEMRSYYNLEHLWGDGGLTRVSL